MLYENYNNKLNNAIQHKPDMYTVIIVNILIEYVICYVLNSTTGDGKRTKQERRCDAG